MRKFAIKQIKRQHALSLHKLSDVLTWTQIERQSTGKSITDVWLRVEMSANKVTNTTACSASVATSEPTSSADLQCSVPLLHLYWTSTWNVCSIGGNSQLRCAVGRLVFCSVVHQPQACWSELVIVAQVNRWEATLHSCTVEFQLQVKFGSEFTASDICA